MLRSLPSKALRRLLPLALAAALAPAAAAAQQAAGESLDLDQVLAITLERSRAVASARQQVALRGGEATAAGGAYDLRLQTEALRAREDARQLSSTGPVSVVSDASTLALGLERRFRAGVTVQPRVTLEHAGAAMQGATPYTTASVDLNVAVPLLRDRGGEGVRTAERVALAGHDAAVEQLRQAEADAVLAAVGAYWAYAAAGQRLDVYRTSEARAERLLAETETLVRAEERPAADLNQLRANLASKRMSRIGAEQALVEARRGLGLAMGISAADIARLAPPRADFPAATPFSAAASRDRLVRMAGAGRADLAAAAIDEQSAHALAGAARRALRPRLDLSMGVGYRGLSLGGGMGGWLSPLYRDLPGVSASLGVSWQAAVGNYEARGLAAQHAALVEQRRLAGADLRERVESGVHVAAEALERGVMALEQAGSAVDLYGVAVENERRKHELGAATLIDVLLAEDNLTNALLALVGARQSHAQAIAALRHHTATLPAAGSAGALLAAP